jgi:hypothetical protein
MKKLTIATALRMHLKMGLGRMCCENINWNELAHHNFQSRASGEQPFLWIP